MDQATKTKGERTRARIVQLAARLFRRDGFESTGIDRLMAEAGLTRGGFYAHFRHKRSLWIESLAVAFEQSRANLFRRGLEGLTGGAWVQAAAARYLERAHVTGRASGCAVPSLGAEVARAPRSVRLAFGEEVEQVVSDIASRLEGDREQARARAWTLLSSWVGAIVLARAVGQDHVSTEVLDAVREASSRP
jgi:TetR/AcrR family transcriptional repressor of nem operon